MNKRLKSRLVFSAIGIFLIVGMGAAIYAGASRINAPLPREELQACVDAVAKSGISISTCATHETLWKRGLRDPIAYYTLWITWFTGVLAGFGMIQGYLTYRQIQLGRDEFNATHRPRLVVREVYWETGKSDGNIISLIVANIGDQPARITESRIEIERTDQRPIFPNGQNTFGEAILAAGEYRKFSIDITDTHEYTAAALSLGFNNSLAIQGVIIYRARKSMSDGTVERRAVFKRRSVLGSTIFTYTDNARDEYSD